ncbi:MAG: hypothetical protein HUU20_23000, partial [Pirellulales bacterium]|nr:hypothetical protein [Pirellulales bacterium]
MASLQFRRQGRPRNYLARREQWRLLLIVLALGLVALLYSQSRNPENFRWFDALRQVPAEAERAAPPRPAAPPASQDLPGMFR